MYLNTIRQNSSFWDSRKRDSIYWLIEECGFCERRWGIPVKIFHFLWNIYWHRYHSCEGLMGQKDCEWRERQENARERSRGRDWFRDVKKRVTLSFKQASTDLSCRTLSLRLFFYAKLESWSIFLLCLSLVGLLLFWVVLFLVVSFHYKVKYKNWSKHKWMTRKKYTILIFGIFSTLISGHDKQVLVWLFLNTFKLFR